MSDNNFVVDKKPMDEREIGRVNNDLNPNPDQAKTQQEIGRVNNELNPNPDQAKAEQEIGRVNNELNQDPSRQGTVPPSMHEIGMVNNEKAEK